MRLLFSLLLVFCAVIVGYGHVYADSDDSCNQFESVQSVILSERTTGSIEEDIEIARVAVTKGACYRDEHYYTGYAIASRIYNAIVHGEARSDACSINTHCRAYYLLYTIDPAIREPAALAAHIALTEQPRIERYHFDRFDSTAAWWDSLSACPSHWFIVGELKVC